MHKFFPGIHNGWLNSFFIIIKKTDHFINMAHTIDLQFIYHTRFFGIHDRDDLAHTGFQTFRRFMDVFQPRLLLHGHSHIYRGDTITSSRYKNTQVINVYPYRVIEWEPESHGRYHATARPG